jgi:hypothetical protein
MGMPSLCYALIALQWGYNREGCRDAEAQAEAPVVPGPSPVGTRIEATMELFFPGSTSITRRFSTDFIELQEGMRSAVGPVIVTPDAAPQAIGAPSYVLRVEYGGKGIAYSGGTEWTEALVEAARGADLFICESYLFDRLVRNELLHRSDRTASRTDQG